MIVRAAFATSDGKYVDRHFGAAERFDIYEINTETQDYERVDVRLVEKACLDHKQSLAATEQERFLRAKTFSP